VISISSIGQRENTRVWAQAEGFDAGRVEVDLAGAFLHQDFALKTTEDVVKQMTGQEYISSLPEDTPQHRLMKDVFYKYLHRLPRAELHFAEPI